MKGTESRCDGAIIIVLIAVVIFAIHNSFSLLPSQISDMPFSSKRFGPMIVGMSGDTGVNGIFYLPERAKISDLLEAAGVGNPEMLDQGMLYKRLSTGKTIVIEPYGSLKITEMSNSNKLTLSIPIDINKATREDLMLIDGIGEKTASQIVEFREASGRYQKVEDLMKVSGIKEKKFRKFKRYFCIDDAL